MACSDQHYQQLLADAVLGKLSAGEMFQVYSHLQKCPYCRETFKTGAAIAGKDYEALSKEIAAHLSEGDLALYYSEREMLELSQIRAIESHLGQCSLCRSELLLIEQVEKEMLAAAAAQPLKGAVFNQPWERVKAALFHPIFAAAVLIVAAVPLFMTWRDHVRPSVSAPSSIPQAIELREGSRSSGSLQIVPKRTDDSYLHLRVPYPHRTNVRNYSASIKRSNDLHTETSVVWLRMVQSGKIDVLIESANFTEGRYELKILDIGRDTSADTLMTSFIFELDIQD